MTTICVVFSTDDLQEERVHLTMEECIDVIVTKCTIPESENYLVVTIQNALNAYYVFNHL